MPSWRYLFSAMTLLALSPLAALAQSTAAPAPADPLWIRILLASGVTAALITGVLGLWFKPWDLRQQLRKIDHEVKEKLRADVTKLEEEAALRLKMEARAEAARLRQKYVNALYFHAKLLRDHIEAVREKLSNDDTRNDMAGWFTSIKRYGHGALRSASNRGQTMSKAEFSAHCHYKFIFPMSTLYYASVFFLFSQRILSLAPFREADSRLSRDLDRCLREVGKAFVVQDAGAEAQRASTMARDNGLWDTVQNSMGAIVRKEEWYLSYPEFCRMFIDTDSPTREDHVFMRALDFFGAFGDADDRDGSPLLRALGAKAIVERLDSLLEVLRMEQPQRESEGPAVPYHAAGT